MFDISKTYAVTISRAGAGDVTYVVEATYEVDAKCSAISLYQEEAGKAFNHKELTFSLERI